MPPDVRQQLTETQELRLRLLELHQAIDSVALCHLSALEYRCLTHLEKVCRLGQLMKGER